MVHCVYASLVRQKQAVKKETSTKINTQQERLTQYQQRHYATYGNRHDLDKY